MRKVLPLLFAFGISGFTSYAQKDTVAIPNDEEDYSQYNNVETVPTKRYCSSKILGISPSKLISVGYDFVAAHQLTAGAFSKFGEGSATIQSNTGLRVAANFPVVSNTRWLINLGFTRWESNYQMKDAGGLNHPLLNTLANTGLRTSGMNATVFKPFNEYWFTIVQVSGDFNGDYKIGELPAGNQGKYSVSALYGKKKHDRMQLAFGISRTYRAGGQAYFPIVMYNYTAPNKKWGIEALLPARANFRYTINARNLLLAGFELEGNAYRLNNMMESTPDIGFGSLELKRSELRPRITYEFGLYKFIWLSIQAGYRINYRFNAEDGDRFRSITNKDPYLMENTLGNAFYTNISINLVSP
jgi:hypothetical protein